MEVNMSTATAAGHQAVDFLATFWDTVKPGGRLHPAWFLEHQGHVLLEGLLCAVIAMLLLQQAYKPSKRRDKPLSDAEIDSLCAEWQPEPLCMAAEPGPQPPVMSSQVGSRVTVDGVPGVLNLASTNFLGVPNKAKLQAACRATIEKYGVGSCGPRGFYGTIDVHLDLEERLARFMRTEEAIIYSYDLATLPSVLPAFATATDLIILDEILGVHEHESDKPCCRKPLNRRWIVVEGISWHHGDLAPLDRIYALKEQYRYRLAVDESLAFGVLGATGRGACEHWGLQPEQVEVICGSLGHALGSNGGFCVGSREIVDHQRLSGLGYCFSASLPPYLATAAQCHLEALADPGLGGVLLPRIWANAAALRRQLNTVKGSPQAPRLGLNIK